jgi:hypothetical protein
VGRFYPARGLTKRAVSWSSAPGADGLAGMAELGPLFPGGQEEEQNTS